MERLLELRCAGLICLVVQPVVPVAAEERLAVGQVQQVTALLGLLRLARPVHDQRHRHPLRGRTC